MKEWIDSSSQAEPRQEITGGEGCSTLRRAFFFPFFFTLPLQQRLLVYTLPKSVCLLANVARPLFCLPPLFVWPLPYTNNQIFAAKFNVPPLIQRWEGGGAKEKHIHTLDWRAEPIVAGNKINLVFIGTRYTSSPRRGACCFSCPLSSRLWTVRRLRDPYSLQTFSWW